MEKKMRFAYDKEADILDISIGKPKTAISREIEDDFFVRIDPKTKKVVGFSVLNFEKWFKGLDDYRLVPMSAEFNLSHN
jgi:uncharacterized protein YuzE